MHSRGKSIQGSKGSLSNEAGHGEGMMNNTPSGSQGNGRTLFRKKVEYQLVEYHSLPAFMKDNEFIHRHYRAEWPLKRTVLSIFAIHNETLNIWTHLIGFFLFLSLTLYTAMKFPKVIEPRYSLNLSDALKRLDLLHKILLRYLPSFQSMDELPHKLGKELNASLSSIHHLLPGWHALDLPSPYLPERLSTWNYTDVCVPRRTTDVLGIFNSFDPTMMIITMSRPITRWPFFAFLVGAMLLMLASSACHLLSCHSARLSYIMHRIDYAGIAALITTSFYPPVYYSFTCYPFFRNLYISLITTVGLITVSISLVPNFQHPEFRTIRALLFSGMGLSGILPILHKLVLFWHRPEARCTAGYETLMGAFYGMGAAVYATRVPERWMPGKFDIAGHSHQLFHVLVVAGAYTHYRAGLVYLRWRDSEGCN